MFLLYMEGIPPIMCSICKESGHHPNNCPELVEPLKSGFYNGSGHVGEEDDD